MESDNNHKPKHDGIEVRPDAWDYFVRAVDVVAKSPPQHRKAKKAKQPKRRASSSKPRNGAPRA
jgi:hypothetical protein